MHWGKLNSECSFSLNQHTAGGARGSSKHESNREERQSGIVFCITEKVFLMLILKYVSAPQRLRSTT